MTGQGIWSGTVSFSLVAIPVRLVRAVTPGRVSFHILHNTDFSPLLRRMYCPQHGTEVSPEEVVRGYEYAPGLYLRVTEEELESVSPERSRTIEILEFIDLDEVDPLYFDHPYYLVPLKGGEKAYRLLAEALARTNRAGVAKFVLGEREYLVAVGSIEGALTLMTLHYAEEVALGEEFAPGGEIEASRREAIATSVERLKGDFEPGRYADARLAGIRELLERKAREAPPVEAPPVEEEESAGPPDLMAALEEAMRDVGRDR